MYSDTGNRRCRRLGSPIRKSPDHRLCASPRSLSQLTTSFFAYLRLGIPTHALSSLTIKSISDTEHSRWLNYRPAAATPPAFARQHCHTLSPSRRLDGLEAAAQDGRTHV